MTYPPNLKDNPKNGMWLAYTLKQRGLLISEKIDEFIKRNKTKIIHKFRKIKKEVDNAKNTLKKYKWPIIDVTRKSVEETAASIIKIHDIYLQND